MTITVAEISALRTSENMEFDFLAVVFVVIAALTWTLCEPLPGGSPANSCGANRDIIDEQMLVVPGRPGSTVVNVDPDGFNL